PGRAVRRRPARRLPARRPPVEGRRHRGRGLSRREEDRPAAGLRREARLPPGADRGRQRVQPGRLEAQGPGGPAGDDGPRGGRGRESPGGVVGVVGRIGNASAFTRSGRRRIANPSYDKNARREGVTRTWTAPTITRSPSSPSSRPA